MVSRCAGFYKGDFLKMTSLSARMLTLSSPRCRVSPGFTVCQVPRAACRVPRAVCRVPGFTGFQRVSTGFNGFTVCQVPGAGVK